MPRGNFGEIRAFNDFTGIYEDVTWATSTVELGGGWGLYSVNEGTIQDVTDEEGGIIQLLTDTGDNDNAALVAGPFKPSNGGCAMEARFKVADDLNVALFAGFSETMASGTPVMPAEYATATMSINGSGGVAGLQYDLDGTTDFFRAASGDGGAVTGTNKNGTAITATTTTASGQTITADKFVVARVEISPSGRIDYSLAADTELTQVESITGAITASDLFFAVLMIENREAAAKEFEVDYVYARGFRDWTA
tara:strand:+ start:14174 stop:14929 length:756 start_codon:yes stop_codon:yes gene_type:complete